MGLCSLLSTWLTLRKVCFLGYPPLAQVACPKACQPTPDLPARPGINGPGAGRQAERREHSPIAPSQSTGSPGVESPPVVVYLF